MDAHLGYVAAVMIGVIATTGGRWIIDVACNVIPKQLVRGEFFVTTAAMTAALVLGLQQALGMSQVAATAIAVVVRFRLPFDVAVPGLGGVGAVGTR